MISDFTLAEYTGRKDTVLALVNTALIKAMRESNSSGDTKENQLLVLVHSPQLQGQGCCLTASGDRIKFFRKGKGLESRPGMGEVNKNERGEEARG